MRRTASSPVAFLPKASSGNSTQLLNKALSQSPRVELMCKPLVASHCGQGCLPPPSQEPCLVIPPAREVRAKAGRWHQRRKASELSSRASTPPLLLLSCLCPTHGSLLVSLSAVPPLNTAGAKVSAFSTRFFINIFSFFLSTVSLAT